MAIWPLEQAKRKRESLTHRLSDGIGSATGPSTDLVGILSAENLANPQMAPLFAGLDNEFEVDVIFYLRPQFQWIPSAWKQWELKRGMSLNDFVAHCINTGDHGSNWVSKPGDGRYPQPRSTSDFSFRSYLSVATRLVIFFT